MVTLRRAQIVNLVEHSYYSNIDFRRLGTVLDCFAHDAVLSVDGRRHRGRDSGIKQYLTQLLARPSHHPPRGARPRGGRGRADVRLPLHPAPRRRGRPPRQETSGRAGFNLENGKLATVTVQTDSLDATN